MKNLYLMLLIVLILCGCKNNNDIFHPQEVNDPLPISADKTKILTQKQVMEMMDRFYGILSEIVDPIQEYLGTEIGLNSGDDTDYMAIAIYFRDNDFSEQLSEMESLYEQIKEVVAGETYVQANARADFRIKLSLLKPVIEMGQSYKNKEITELSNEQQTLIYFLKLL